MRLRPLLVIPLVVLLCAACARDAETPLAEEQATAVDATGSVTISAHEAGAAALSWQRPRVELAEADDIAQARERACEALDAGDLYEGEDAAIPLYLALLERDPDDRAAKRGLDTARTRLIAVGDEALAQSGDDPDALRNAHRVAAVARDVWPQDEQTQGYLQRLDRADHVWELNRLAEADLAQDRLGESGEGALPKLREALELAPGQPRAMQNLAAVESALIRRAEAAAASGDFDSAGQWLEHAAVLRPDIDTVPDARERIARMRTLRIARLRDQGVAALAGEDGIAQARAHLAELLRIAEPGDPAAVDLRERIDLAVHYGLFRPGQVFTDALGSGGRGPRMVVIPHGAFTMGAPESEPGSTDAERPQRNIRFDRGFAMAVTEVTVGEYRRFVNATGYQTRSARRGFSMVYDERSGNFVRRSNVDWRHDHLGAPAADTAPVLHASAVDAAAYADWLSQQSGQRYRLPSEAEFEYALRAGTDTAFAWGDGSDVPAGVGNLTGSEDRSPSGRQWSNAFAGYGDGYWGPAPVASFVANRWGVHDLAGNVSEWVADCWHENYRRAPADATPWVNPGCRTHVIRGGSWASAPEQARSAWRAPAQRDTTNARLGFRVVRDL